MDTVKNSSLNRTSVADTFFSQIKQTLDKKRKAAKRGKTLASLFGELRKREDSDDEKVAENHISPTSKSNKILALANFLLEEYGGPRFLIELADTVLDFAGELLPEKKKYQSIVDALKYTLPGTIATYDLYKRVNKFLNRQDKNTTYDDQLFKILTLLGLSLENYDYIASYDVDKIGREVVAWILNKPKTEGFKILGYFGTTLEPIDPKSLGEKTTEVFILIEIGNTKLVWYLEVKNNDFGIILYQSSIYGIADKTISKKKTIEFRISIIKEFIKSFDIKNNVLIYKTGLIPRERIVIEEGINQFDVHGLATEIRKVLAIGKKRGYALVGLPGTGKTSIVLKLEDMIREYPFIYLSPSEFEYKEEIKEVFSIIRCIQPCIVVLEDLDSYNFKSKTERLGIFLNEIDAVRGDLNVAFIASVNDTSNVHYSLINRPGRFDQVMMIHPPLEQTEVYQIMRTKFHKELRQFHKEASECFLVSWEDINKDLLQKALTNRLTQVDVCDIIERCLLESTSIDNNLIEKSLNALLSTKKAIKECNFKDQDPNSVIIIEAEDNGITEAPCQAINTREYAEEQASEEAEIQSIFSK